MSESTAVTADHLRRLACLYVRQSSLQQVQDHQESTARQYALKRRALALGWAAERIVVIDEDLGLSGASAAERTGFQRIVADVGLGRVGMVMGLEVSRLARNSSDWHRLLEICALSAYRPVRLPEGLTPGLSDEAFFEPSNHTYPFGCHIAMLEIDRETGEPRLLKMVAVEDAGHLINPLIVEGQIHGGLAQGIGQAMIEEVVYGADGQPLTASLMDYALPRASDFPRFELDNTVTPTPVNPLGAKGVGEVRAMHRQCRRRRPDRFRRAAPRHDAAAREAVAHHSGPRDSQQFRPLIEPATL